jgi:hypothetical protein
MLTTALGVVTAMTGEQPTAVIRRSAPPVSAQAVGGRAGELADLASHCLNAMCGSDLGVAA